MTAREWFQENFGSWKTVLGGAPPPPTGQALDLNCVVISKYDGAVVDTIHKRLAYVSGQPGYTIASGKALTYRCMLCGVEVHVDEPDY